MREILFRGKRLDNGEWVFGYFCEFANNRTGAQESYIQTVKQDGRIDLIHKVDPKTVGQLTGLTDKNGRRIFEGDIVRYMNKETMVVVWNNDSASFAIAYSAINFKHCHNFKRTHLLEVIGNVHDNPELLENP